MQLPIDAHIATVHSALTQTQCLIIKAAPGTGKTTRIPPSLLSCTQGRIIVLEPRRLAARLSAARIAEELGEPLGQTCGYQVRYEGISSANTRILFVTEGVFARMLLDDPDLTGTAAVIIDEFHERHIHTDLALAIMRRLIASSRPDLKLIIMSATIDTTALESALPQARVINVAGQTYPIAIEYQTRPGDTELPAGGPLLEDRITSAIEKMTADSRCPGNILVFLSGLAEIRRIEADLNAQAIGRQFLVLPLAADLPPAAHAQVFATSQQRKIILATNVAETSLTLPNITGVIDPGLAKIAGHASWSGMPTLDVRKISQAAAIQRAGRAGRTSSGVAYRLYSETDFRSRAQFSTPDMQRLDLADIYLEVKFILSNTPQASLPLDSALPWLEAPDPRSVAKAKSLLTLLGALDADDRLTPLGRQLAQLPINPRLAATALCGKDLGIGPLATLAAVILGERIINSRREQARVVHDCDVLLAISHIEKMDPQTRHRIEQSYSYLAKRVGISAVFPRIKELVDTSDAELSTALLAGFPDRVAKQRELDPTRQRDRAANRLYNLCLGRGAVLAEESALRDTEWLIALDAAESVIGRSADRSTKIHIATKIDPSLLPLAPGQLSTSKDEVLWMDDAERVDTFRSSYYGQLLVKRERIRIDRIAASEIEDLLCSKLKARWPKPFADDSDLLSYHARLDFLVREQVTSNLPRFEGEMLDLLMAAICEGKRSFKEIAERTLAEYIEEQLGYDEGQSFAKLAPLHISNSEGKRLRVYYADGKPPMLEAMIQDFFGMSTTPSLLQGRIPVTLSLLAPNKRPIQVTADLASFWRQSYPDIKRELGRRYPRHFWPDDPASARPIVHKPRA